MKEFEFIDVFYEILQQSSKSSNEKKEQKHSESYDEKELIPTESENETKAKQEEYIKEKRKEIEQELGKEKITIDNIVEKISKALGISEREAKNILLFIDFALWLKDKDEKGKLQPTSFAKKYSIKTLTDFANWLLKTYNKLSIKDNTIKADVFQNDLKNLFNSVVPRGAGWIYMTFIIFQKDQYKNYDDPKFAMYITANISAQSFAFRRFGMIVQHIFDVVSLLKELDKIDGIYDVIHEYVNKQTFSPKENED